MSKQDDILLIDDSPVQAKMLKQRIEQRAMLYDAERLGRNQVIWPDGKLEQLREK